MHNPEYKWTEELKNTLVSYLEDGVPFISHNLAKEWGMHHMTLSKRIREVCHELGYTAINVTSAKKPVEVNKNPTEIELGKQADFIRRYANKTLETSFDTTGQTISRYKVDCRTEEGDIVTLTIKAVSEEHAMHEARMKQGNLKPVRVVSKQEDARRRSSRELLNRGNY